jgi:hypothetical protein
MKYKDKSTLHHHNKWDRKRNERDSFWNWDSRKSNRDMKRELLRFSWKIEDKIWWNSLSFQEQKSCLYESHDKNMSEEDMKRIYKGDVSKQREFKIKLLIS